MRSLLLLAGVLLPLLTVAGLPGPAAADGEAGLVIQHGDGSLETYCVAFEGSGISGEDLLRAASVTFEQVGGLVCSVGEIEEEGCPGATSLASCTCRCRPGSGDCVYWSYFTKKEGEPWVYSISGFTSQSSGDGEMQAWRWGPGGPSSAPSPAEVTFEEVCGPRPAGARATASPASAVRESGATEAGQTPPTTPTPSATAAAGAGQPTITSGVSGSAGGDGDGIPAAAIVVFIGVATLLVAGTVAGIQRRSRSGS